MPVPGVSLIPRGSKPKKKRRTSFRPASKKPNQNKNNKDVALLTERIKPIFSANELDSTKVTTNVSASKCPARSDSVQGTPTKKEDRAKKSSMSMSHSKDNSLEKDETPGEKKIDTRKGKFGSKQPSSSKKTRKTECVAFTSKKPCTRKRKVNSFNNAIDIGSSLRRKKEIFSTSSATCVGSGETNNYPMSAKPQSSTVEQMSKPNDKNGKENNPAALHKGEKHALTATKTKGNSLLRIFSARDDINHNQLESAEIDGEATVLSSYCSFFNGAKRKLEDKDRKKNSSSSKSTNREKKDKAKDSNTKSNASFSSTNHKKSNLKVDASTNGAPSVQIVDGQIVLQESSVVLPSRRTVQEVEEEFQGNVVEEDEQLNNVQASYTSFITKGDHVKTRKKGSWSIEETAKFYVALQQLGTDFGSMEALFFENQRTRKQLKNKYRRELAKNSTLVEKLALNPKYQIQLDMTGFNLKVDPKRITAHENEEPPAYEPTGGDEVQTELSDRSRSKFESNENRGYYNGVFDKEKAVEEDSEEERRAELLTKQEASETTATNKISSPKFKNQIDPSCWSNVGEVSKEAGLWEGPSFGKGGVSQETCDGPSMDDFFGDSYADDDDRLGKGGKARTNTNLTTKQEEAPASPTQVPIGKKKKETSIRVSLVPKKTYSKSRRQKIRPSRRKN